MVLKNEALASPQKEKTPKAIRFERWLCAASLLIIGILLYKSALKNGFIWDDDFLILKNHYLQSLHRIDDFFRHHLGYGSGEKNLYYRPLQETAYALDYHFWKLNPFGYHLTNVLIHVLNSLLVFFLSSHLLKKTFIPFLAGLLFLSQPMHTQAVTYIAGRADLLLAFFILSGIYAYSKIKHPSRVGIAGFLFLLGALSKEVGAIFPILILIYDYIFEKKIRWKNIAFFCSILAFYALLRHQALALTAATMSPEMPPPGFSFRFPVSFKLLSFYCQNLVWPTELRLERTMKGPESWLDPYILSAIAIYGAFLFIFIKKRSEIQAETFFASWFMLFWFPVANLFPLRKALADHWMYLSSIGFYLCVLSFVLFLIRKIVSDAKTQKLLLTLICLPFFFYFSSYVQTRNAVWRDKITFFNDILKYSPNNNRVLLNLANVYLYQDDFEKASELYYRILKNRPDYADAYGNLAVIDLRQEKYEEAEKKILKTIELDPYAVIAHTNLALLYEKTGRLPEAIKALESAMKLSPDSFDIYFAAAKIENALGNKEKAVFFAKECVKISPQNDRAQRLLDRILNSESTRDEDLDQKDPGSGFQKSAQRAGSTYTVVTHYNEWGEPIDENGNPVEDN